MSHQTQTTIFPTRFGLGLAALGRPGYINLGHANDLNHQYTIEAMEEHAHAVLDVAWAGGMRYFDAARSYGRAELFLQSWLAKRSIAAEGVSVGSKWGYTYTADWQIDTTHHEVKEHSLARFNTQWQESQQLLGNYLRLYQIHSATLESGVLTNHAVLSALATTREKNDVAIGISFSGPAQAEALLQALAIEVDGVRLFDAVQATWNLLEPSAGAALRQAHESGVGVIIKEALANGRLTSRNKSVSFAPQLARLQTEATRLQTTVDALALAAVLQNPWVDVVLSGAASVLHLEQNLAAQGIILDEDAEETFVGMSETPEEYWATRSALPWN